jgi:hypothetical protein
MLGPARIAGPRDLGVAKVPNYGASLDENPVDVGRHRRVLERVTEIAGWKAARARSARSVSPCTGASSPTSRSSCRS